VHSSGRRRDALSRSTLGWSAPPESTSSRPTGESHRRVATGVDDSSVPSWSIDGRWLFFAGRITGRIKRVHQIFKVPIEGGAAIQLTSEGGGFAPQP
jgi:Tol biopolymer transport system component